MKTEKEKLCSDCVYSIHVDFGYSNYTVEGTTVNCAKGLIEPFDRWYGKDPRDAFAETCPHFNDEGDPAKVDCDCSDFLYHLDKGAAQWQPYATSWVTAEDLHKTL